MDFKEIPNFDVDQRELNGAMLTELITIRVMLMELCKEVMVFKYESRGKKLSNEELNAVMNPWMKDIMSEASSGFHKAVAEMTARYGKKK